MFRIVLLVCVINLCTGCAPAGCAALGAALLGGAGAGVSIADDEEDAARAGGLGAAGLVIGGLAGYGICKIFERPKQKAEAEPPRRAASAADRAAHARALDAATLPSSEWDEGMGAQP